MMRCGGGFARWWCGGGAADRGGRPWWRRVYGFGDFGFVEFFNLQSGDFEIKTKTKENRKLTLSLQKA